jgi:hypothetical protein
MVGLSNTLHFLAETENEAAVPVLLAALGTVDRRRPKQALQALLQRSSPAAETEVLIQWHKLTEPMRQLVAERPDWLSGAIHSALAGSRDSADAQQLYRNACDAALVTRDYDQIPALAAAAADLKNPWAQQAAEVVLLLAEMLFEELHLPRDYRVRRDPQLQRDNLLPSLERMADSVDQHRKAELVEALLLLADRDTATVKRILQSPRDPSYPVVVRVLEQSSRPGVIRLLLSYLDDPHAPRAALDTLAGRRDLQFIRQLLRKIGNQPPQVVRNNLHRIEEIAWLSDASAVYGALAESEQAAAIQLASEANLAPAQALQILSLGLQDGSPGGRRAAAAGLVKFSGPEADEVAWQALDDDDPVVRAQAVTRMGKHATPTVIPRLIEMLDSPHQLEREAAQACLDEYNFEMQAPIRVRRARAIEIAILLQMIPDLFDAIRPLLDDEDQYTRIDAIRALATCDLEESKQALRRALLDHSPLVVKAAEDALAKFSAVHESDVGSQFLESSMSPLADSPQAMTGDESL